jgi:hypothetical protein
VGTQSGNKNIDIVSFKKFDLYVGAAFFRAPWFGKMNKLVA